MKIQCVAVVAFDLGERQNVHVNEMRSTEWLISHVVRIETNLNGFQTR